MSSGPLLPALTIGGPPIPESMWDRVFSGRSGRVVQAATSAITAVACTALRALNFNRVVNGVSTLGLGCAITPLVSAFVPEQYDSNLQQVLHSGFGAASLFLITQLMYNYPVTSDGVLAASGVMLGVHVSLVVRKFFKSLRGIEAPISKAIEGVRFKPIVSPPMRAVLAAKLTAIGVGAFVWERSVRAGQLVYQGLSSWLTCYYVGDLAGDALARFVNRKIEVADPEGNLFTPWRTVKKAVGTFSYFALSLVMVPWTYEPKTAARTHQLWVVGTIAGLLCGYVKRLQQEELEEQPISTVDAARPRPAVELMLYKVWKVAWPILTFCGVSSFIISQMGPSGLSWEDKVAIGPMMYSGYLLGTLRHLFIERCWDVSKTAYDVRDSWTSKVLKWSVLSQLHPRIAGISPANLYYLLVNVVEMSSGQTLTSVQRGLVWASWFFYGTAMSTELGQTSGNLKGSAFQAPALAWMNLVLTWTTFLRTGI